MFNHDTCIWSKLTDLDISHIDTVNNKLLISIGQTCPALQSINISNITNVNDVSLKNLGKKRPGIQRWILNNCKNVSNLGIKYIVDICKDHLRSLEVGGKESRVDDGGILYLSKHAHKLEELNCSENKLVTDISMADITSNSRLQQIYFSRNNSIDGSLCNYLSKLKK